MTRKPSTFFITTPIYYVNDRPHVGHAYTTIAADVIARFHRANGEHVRFLTGTDEHGAKIAESAEKAGKTPKKFVDEKAEEFKGIWKSLDISYDTFSRTTSPRHREAVSIFLQKLYDQGDIYRGEYVGLYCVGCEKFLTEKELVDGLCPDHKREPQVLKEQNYFFRFTKYLPKVAAAIESGDLVIEPQERRNEVLALIEQGLEDFSVSRESVKWGIPIPWDKKHVCYVWVEALQNYISDIGYGVDPEMFRTWWPADVHLMAKEILKFHALFWPALLIAAGERPPQKIFAHGFFTINNQKMSKTIGNVIRPEAMVKTFGADATRYLLLSQFPFGQDGNIDEKRMREKYHADLSNNIGNLVSRTSQMIEKFLNGSVRPLKHAWEKDVETVREKLQRMDLYGALAGVMKLATLGNQFIDTEKPWIQAKSGAGVDRTLGKLVTLMVDVGKLLTPFMPSIGERMIQQFQSSTIIKSDPLFPRL
ncbi:MAG: methionine--tRNA ligase [Candidatus Kerfeldbacteria bacterium]|nr:methionine--tRNA ligase [Candidatus Kerfeldbacteria bacterium]